MVTFRLTVEQFRRLLDVILADDTPDHLTNLVLMACTRPRDGIISVPVPLTDARAICALVDATPNRDDQIGEVAALLQRQLEESPS